MSDLLKPGEMNRFLVAQSFSETKGAKGNLKKTWSDSFSFFASSTDESINEQFSQLETVGQVSIEFVTHFRSDLTRQNRIKDEDGNLWEIKTFSKSKDGLSIRLGCQRIDE
jgi:head-tail adaptor